MLAITGGKGGCGKTTTALGLARALARDGADPLVVDADTDLPDIHLLAAVDREPTWDRLASGQSPERLCQRVPWLGGVAVLPGGTQERLGQALRRLSDWHGPVLVDCAAGAGPPAVTPLRHADRSVLTTVNAPEALSDGAKAARIAAQLDAPPVVTVIRSEQPPSELGFDGGAVTRLPSVDVGTTTARAVETVLHDPQVQTAYRRAATTLRVGRSGEPIFSNDTGGGMFNGA
jgi:septum site-determining protein MinD